MVVTWMAAEMNEASYLGVMLDGQRVSLVPALLDYLATAGMEAVTSLGPKPRTTPCRCCCRCPMGGC